MKKLSLIFCSIAVAGLTMTSCSNDDNNDNSSDDVTIAGTYHLTEVNTEAATDFDQDGMPHTNQMQESSCYDDGKITLNSDNTFSYVLTGILINEQAGTAGCMDPVTVSGTWEIYSGTGTTAIIDATYEDENGNNVTLTLNKEENKITIYSIFTPYPDRNNEGGAYYANGSVEYVFMK